MGNSRASPPLNKSLYIYATWGMVMKINECICMGRLGVTVYVCCMSYMHVYGSWWKYAHCIPSQPKPSHDSMCDCNAVHCICNTIFGAHYLICVTSVNLKRSSLSVHTYMCLALYSTYMHLYKYIVLHKQKQELAGQTGMGSTRGIKLSGTI